MKVVCWLNMAHPDLSKAEVCALLSPTDQEVVDDLLVVDVADWQPAKRLALSRAAYEFWWRAPAGELMKKIDSFKWNKSVVGSFSVSVHHARIQPKQIADRIWHWLEKPAVNLKKPDTPLAFFFVEDEVICCKFLWANTEDFSKRRPHLRRAHHPTSMDPRLARAMVNLTGAPTGAAIYDPFCGTGGLLIEAALMGLRPHGSDLDTDMVERASANCQQQSVECLVEQKDATHIYSPEKFVVTDLPYGRSSGKRSIKQLEELYAAYLERLVELLRVRAVLGYPADVKMDKLLKAASLESVQTFSLRVHRSLTRKIVVVEPGRAKE